MKRTARVLWALAAAALLARAAVPQQERAADLAALRDFGPAAKASPERWQDLRAAVERLCANGALPPLADDALADLAAEAALVADPSPQLQSALRQVAESTAASASTRARMWSAFGETCFRRGELDAARAAFAAAGDTDEALGFHAATRTFHVEMAAGDLARAYAALDRAAPLATGDLERRRTLQLRASLSIRMGLMDDAAVAISQLQPAANEDTYDSLARARLSAELLLVLERWDEALLNVDAWIAAAKEAGPKGLGFGLLARISKVELRARIDSQAPDLQELQALSSEPDLQPMHRAAIQRLAIEAHLARGDADAAMEIARQLAGSLPLRGLPALDLTAVGAAMLASPTDAADLVELRGALDAAWAAQIQTWQDLGERTGRLAFLQLRSRRDLGALLFRALVREHGDRAGAECLRRLLAAERAGSAARALGLQPGTPAAVQATLAPAGGLLVAYLPAPLGSFAVVASAERIQAFELPSDLGLRPLATRLRQGLAADATAQQMRADALAAGTMLTTADMRAAWRQAKGIVFVGKDLLAGLPMECLAFDDGAEPPWLGLRTAVSCLPSMSLGLHLAAREKAVAAPQARALFATELAPADAARWGMQALDTSAQRQQATLAQVAAAQRRIVAPFSRADLRAEPAAAMALFAHGIYAADRESPNGFLAGPDGDRTGAVFAPDCGQLRFAPITALAVCGAARTALRRGDDGGGDLVDAVLQHGAEATLCSAIDLRVDDALDFVSEFFGALASGQDAAAAALSARRACARGATDRPSRWAGMSLHGLAGTTAPLRGADPADWRMRAALAAALIALLGLLARGYKKMKGNSGVTKRRLGGKSGGSV